MCQHAWHMEKAIYGVWELFVEAGSSKKEKEGEKRRGKEKKEREGKKKEREGEEMKKERRRKGKRCSDDWNSSDQEVKSIYSMRVALREVWILPTLVSFYPLSYCFGLLLGPRCVMFMAYFVVLIEIWPILRSQLRWGYSRSKGLLPKRIWVENLRVWEFPKFSRNPWAHYCVDWRNSVAPVALQLQTVISFSSELRFTRSWTL